MLTTVLSPWLTKHVCNVKVWCSHQFIYDIIFSRQTFSEEWNQHMKQFTQSYMNKRTFEKVIYFPCYIQTLVNNIFNKWCVSEFDTNLKPTTTRILKLKNLAWRSTVNWKRNAIINITEIINTNDFYQCLQQLHNHCYWSKDAKMNLLIYFPFVGQDKWYECDNQNQTVHWNN